MQCGIHREAVRMMLLESDFTKEDDPFKILQLRFKTFCEETTGDSGRSNFLYLELASPDNN